MHVLFRPRLRELADRPSDARYGTSIRVKTNLVEVLRSELARKSWKREQVVVGTATDPYQPAEGRFRLTRGAIQALADARRRSASSRAARSSSATSTS